MYYTAIARSDPKDGNATEMSEEDAILGPRLKESHWGDWKYIAYLENFHLQLKKKLDHSKEEPTEQELHLNKVLERELRRMTGRTFSLGVALCSRERCIPS